MAPLIQIPAEDTLKTLQNVLKRRVDSNRILKEREKMMLSGEDYRRMRVDLNNTQFLQPLDSDNQYWRDFKMLYRRVNGAFVDANDSNEVVKVCMINPSPTLFCESHADLVSEVHQQRTKDQVWAGHHM